MPRSSAHSANTATHTHTSEAAPAQETVFLLSISRDEDDAAALRADLKRSPLSNYKIQHCANLDDALQLLRVCGFDLVFVRLDDFQDKQSAVDHLRTVDPDQAIIALVTGRLLATPGFSLPRGIASTCRVEDLSPTLVAALIDSTLERRRSQAERHRIEQELQIALEAAQLGRWTFDLSSNSITFDAASANALQLQSPTRSLRLAELIALAHPEDQPNLQQALALAAETGARLQTSFRLHSDAALPPRLDIIGQKSPAPSAPQLFGFLRRSQPASELYERIASANQAILAASKELQSLAPTPPPATPAQPAPAPASHDHITPPAAPPRPQPNVKKITVEPGPSLAIDRQSAFQNVLKSLSTKQPEPAAPSPAAPAEDPSFPFDFSTDSKTDYSPPDPRSEGFVGAAKRLVAITQKGHNLRVSLAIKNEAAVEADAAKDLIFETLRELLTNVVKHARAKQCAISLARDEDDWVLQVQDDGVGLENNLVSISTPLNKIGLFRIRTRLAHVGGQLDLTPIQPSGLVACARLPVSAAQHGPSHEGERA